MSGKEKFFGTWKVVHADNPALTNCCMKIEDGKGDAVTFAWECPGYPDQFPAPWNEVPRGCYSQGELSFILPNGGQGTPYRLSLRGDKCRPKLYCAPEETVLFSQAGGDSQGSWTAEDESGAARMVA